MKINQHILGLKPSSTLFINQKVKELRKSNHTITHFGFGQSPFPIHHSIVEELKAHATHNHYLPVNGLKELRKKIATFLSNHQGVERDASLIFIGPGSKELLYQSVLILEGEFLIPKGSWVSYIPQIISKGGRYAILETTAENGYKLTASSLEAFLKRRKNKKQVLILNSPNNPTGSVYSSKESRSLAAVCRAYKIIVLSDEIYSQINFKASFSPSISKYYPEGTIVFGGLSKVFSAGGYRLGFLSLPKELEQLSGAFSSLFSETFSCVSSPIQFAAMKAYEYASDLQAYVATSASILGKIASYMVLKLTENNIRCTRPQGAFYMMIDFDLYKTKIHHHLQIKTSLELASYLLENYQLALLPGADFGFDPSELCFRLAFVDFDGETLMKNVQSETIMDEELIKKNCPRIYKGVNQLIRFKNENC